MAFSPHPTFSAAVRAFACLVGLAVVAHLARNADTFVVREACRRAGWSLAWVVAAPVVGLFVHTLAWRLLLPHDARPTVFDSFRAFVAAQAGNEIGFGFLGEPLKVAALPRAHRDAAVAALALDNLTAAMALVVFFSGLGLCVAAPTSSSVSLPAALGTGLTIGAVILASSHRAIRARVTGIGNHGGSHRARIAAATGLHLLGKAWLVAEMALALQIFGTATLHGSLVLALASATGATVGAPVPGQVGVVEAALVAAASRAGIDPQVALAIAFVRRFRSVVWLLVGALAAIALTKTSFATTPTETRP